MFVLTIIDQPFISREFAGITSSKKNKPFGSKNMTYADQLHVHVRAGAVEQDKG